MFNLNGDSTVYFSIENERISYIIARLWTSISTFRMDTCLHFSVGQSVYAVRTTILKAGMSMCIQHNLNGTRSQTLCLCNVPYSCLRATATWVTIIRGVQKSKVLNGQIDRVAYACRSKNGEELLECQRNELMTRHGLGLIPQKIFLVLETHGADVVTPRNGNLCLSWAVWLGTYLTVPRRLGHTRKPEHIPKFYCSSSLTKERQTVCSSQWAIIPSLQFLMDVVVSGVQLVSFSSFFPM